MKIGRKEFDTENNTYIMGILNTTPDSFSDGGKYKTPERALLYADQMILEGADIIDIGGESTRPGSSFVSDEEEIERVVPIIAACKKELDVPISLDTYKSSVAKAGIEAGADLINDIWNLTYDKEMAQVIAQNNVACCLVHNRKEASYHNFLSDVAADLEESLNIAKQAGIREDAIILDPGIGFGKSYAQNLLLLQNLGIFHKLHFPLLLGASKKSVIGLTLDLPVQESMEGTLTTTVFAVQNNYAFVRVHDVEENLRVIQMTRAMLNRKARQ